MENQFKQFQIEADIIKALDLLEYRQGTEIQMEVIPKILAGQDIVAKAQTGSGKTAAFAIPLCHLVDWEENKPQALVLTPTRELAMQVQEEISHIGKFKRIKVPAIYGKQSFLHQQRDLKQKSHIVVGTPGRILDHLEQGTLEVGYVQYLIIDEADEMLKLGFLEQVEAIMAFLPSKRITLLFSATMPHDVMKLAERYMDEPVHIEAHAAEVTTKRIEHRYYDCTDWDKVDLLQGILTVLNPDSCIIFANMRETVDYICDELLDHGFTCDRLHGGMEQWDRTDVMKEFKRGGFRYLVATDVAARGIDVSQISLVVNFDLPYERENYVHRIGRTGRAGRNGMAISLANEKELKHLKAIEEFIQLPITLTKEPSYQEVEDAKDGLIEKMRQMPQGMSNKHHQIEAEIMKLHIADGKKMKIRPVDIVGTLCAIEGMTAKDIGIITILDWSTYVEILNHKGEMVLKALQTKPIKGQVRKVVKADR